ncbi:EAL domain-containing protein [Stomatohabitans albus]|uniref:EAL domain-containing protein n=1 Tax=Stomatohabitans albus TaxID=3110766 RepID=UPI00300DA8C9
MISVVKLWFVSVIVNCVVRELTTIFTTLPDTTPIWATMAVGVLMIMSQYTSLYGEIGSVLSSASRLMWADMAILNTFYVAWIWESHGRYITEITTEHGLVIVLWIVYTVVFLAYAPLVWMSRRTEGTLTVAIGGESIKVAALLSMISDLNLHPDTFFPVILIAGTWLCVIGIQVAKDSAMRRVYIGPQPDTITVVLVVSLAWAFLIPTLPEHLPNISFRTIMRVDTFNWVFMLLTFIFVNIRVLSMRLNTRNYMSELTKLVLIDSITNTDNRYALSVFKVEVPSWLLVTDFDGFKAVNELRGSSAGDALLKRYCDRLKAVLRPSVGLFRLSNDEFALVVPKQDYSLKEIGTIVLNAGHDELISEVGVSIGVTSIDPGQSMNEALAEAATALSHAKTTGRNRWVYLQKHLALQRQREIDLQRSIVGWRGNLNLKFWPVLNSVFPDAEVVMLEAVPVWDDLEVGKVDPMDMWLEAERVGRATDLANLVVTQWLRSVRSWADSGYPRPVSVYLPLAVIRDADFMENLQSRLSDAGDLAQWLIINVSEDVFGCKDDSIVQGLAKLRETGVRIGINDFGIGPAMVGEIAYTPIDVVRVAPELLFNLNEATSLAVVRVLINLSRDVGMNIILAGVSTHHLRYLQELGTTLVTGPIAGKALIDAELYQIHQPPLPAREFQPVARAR